MVKPVLVCEKCGETITPEEIAVGLSLICPKCEKFQGTNRPKESCGSGAKSKITPAAEERSHGSCCCGHGG